MAATSSLKEQIQELVRKTSKMREVRTAARRQEMMELSGRKVRFEHSARKCMTDAVLPRLEELRESLENGNAVQISTDGTTACLGLRSSDTFPVGADLSVSVGHDPDIRSLEFSWKVSIIPILVDYDRDASLSVELESPDLEKVGRFIDERILRFVSDYLRIHEPDSPYLKNAEVHDLVCNMRFPASEAAARITIGHRTYYFCAEECAARFEADRERYFAGRFM